MELEACLPDELRGPDTKITKIAAGLSGAGVYRVDAGDRAFVLKIFEEAVDGKVEILRRAAEAGVAPRLVHVDAARRAIVSEFVRDRSFVAWFMTPATREAALAELARTFKRVHELPIPAGAEPGDPRGRLEATRPDLDAPAFVRDAIGAVLAEQPPPRDRTNVLSHNDANPSNLVYDGARLMLLDWDVAAPNDPFYDLATVALFLRMDEPTCLRLLAAYDGTATLPARFAYNRRLVAALCGTTFLGLARSAGYAGAGDDSLESTLALGDVYQRMRAGTLGVATAEGQWRFGLALVKESR